jgi:hypothetical protein
LTVRHGTASPSSPTREIETMLVVIAIAAIVFLSYAVTFDKIGDAVPQKVADAYQNATAPTNDKT